MRYVTRIERFQLGQYPMVCARSGLPATKMVPVQARRTTVWPWMLLPFSVVWFAIVKWVADSDHPWGKLPFAEGHVEGITATYEKSIGVIIDGVHPKFVEATRQSQRECSTSTDSPCSSAPTLDGVSEAEGIEFIVHAMPARDRSLEN